MVMDDPFPPDLRVEREAMALLSAGHEVTILTFKEGCRRKEVVDHQGIEVVSLPISWFWHKMSALAYSMPFYHHHLSRRLAGVMRGYEVDVLHIHDLRIARAAFDACPKDCKVVLDLHENRPEIMRSYRHVLDFPGSLFISPTVWARFERQYIAMSDATVVVTREAEVWYRDREIRPKREFWVVPNYSGRSFNPNPIPKTWDGGRLNLVYIGDTGERRGLMVAFAALKALAEDRDVMLHVLGESTFQPRLRELVEQWELQDRVTLHGWVDPDRFDDHLSKAHIGICPIQRNVHHDTTYANKIFQYMAYGMPILVSDCPAQAAVVEEFGCGAVHKADSPEDFSAALEYITADADTFQKMSEAGLRATREGCNWEMAADRLVAQYASLLRD